LYSGPVSYMMGIGTALNNPGTLISLAGITRGQIIVGSGSQGIIQELTNSAGDQYESNVNFPRAPVILLASCSATSQFQFAALAQNNGG
jgi:hypothetical protein